MARVFVDKRILTTISFIYIFHIVDLDMFEIAYMTYQFTSFTVVNNGAIR